MLAGTGVGEQVVERGVADGLQHALLVAVLGHTDVGDTNSDVCSRSNRLR